MPRTFPGRSKPAISPSEIESAMMCVHRSYLELQHPRDYKTTLAQARGTAVHAAAKYDADSKLAGRGPVEVVELQQVAAAHFEDRIEKRKEEIHYYPKEVAVGTGIAIGREKDRTAWLAWLYGHKVSPEIEPDFAERRFFIELKDSPFDLTGQIDQAKRPAVGMDVGGELVPVVVGENLRRHPERLHPIPGTGRIWDFKTRARARSQEQADRSGQLTMYAMLYRAQLKVWPGQVILKDLIQPKAGGEPKVKTQVTVHAEPEAQVLINRLNAYTAMLEAGVTFPAPTTAWWCGPNACQFWNECLFVRGTKEGP